ncbi:MAG: AbgT family transporter [Gemmataceae bacterium]|nr:AbgT family transporter [Gemmataceae bacterium]
MANETPASQEGTSTGKATEASPAPAPPKVAASPPSPTGTSRPAGFLAWVEAIGNKLPDPAMLFVWALLATWLLSALLAPIEFEEIDPRTKQPLQVKSQLTGQALTGFLTKMVKTFTDFPPLGLVLVTLLGVGVAEHVGFINALIKGWLRFTPKTLLTPMLILVGIISHTAADTGYVLVIPLGGVIFYAAGRHPLAGIAAAFAAVSGGFSANFIPSGLDPLLQGFTQSAAQILEPRRTVNPLCNWYFMAFSSLLITIIGWYLTDRVIEPRLRRDTVVDGDPADMPTITAMTSAESLGLVAGLTVMLLGLVILTLACLPRQSPFRNDQGELTAHGAPLMEAIVPLIFLLFLFPAVAYGIVAGTVRSHRDIVKGMSKSMGTMGYYLVLAFFAAQFTYAFRESNLGALVALKGAALLKSLDVTAEGTIIGIIVLTTLVNLLIGSASAKWALLAPIFVPMLMQLGLSPELTQAAYRIGDSSTNIITPLMPYFPLVVAFSQRYVKNTGVGTLAAMMISYSLSFLVGWSLFLLLYWKVLQLPLGLGATYTISLETAGP